MSAFKSAADENSITYSDMQDIYGTKRRVTNYKVAKHMHVVKPRL